VRTPSVLAKSRPRVRWPERVLMVVTDPAAVGDRDLAEVVAAAVRGGANVVQLRAKELPGGELLALARRLRGVTAGRALLLINDRPDVALLAGADGVHLSEAGLPVAPVRAWLPASLVVGRSVHDFHAAREAEADGADYLLVGTIYPSPSHPEREPAGATLLREIHARVRTPIVAIGGITPSRVRECLDAGAQGVAVVSAILRADDPETAAADLATLVFEG